MKTRWAVGKGLAGVFFWEATQDRLTDNTHPLIEAAAEMLESTEPSRETQ
jgi:GH18 family chitinase